MKRTNKKEVKHVMIIVQYEHSPYDPIEESVLQVPFERV